MMSWLEASINKQRDVIEAFLREPLQQLAKLSSIYWGDREKLDAALKMFLDNKADHRCRLLYVIDQWGLQHSSNISDEIIDTTIIGQDLSNRPYIEGIKARRPGDDPVEHIILSDVYVDKQTRKPCITALHSVIIDDVVKGYIAADFGVKDLPLKAVEEMPKPQWRQIKGDPSIRSTLFQQTRAISAMDSHIDEVLDVVESLMTEQGIFHAKLHFSSSRATLWPYDDPYRYRLHVLDEIINPKVCLVYARTAYPEAAVIAATQIPRVLQMFKTLREADETIYLRAASLNVMNGIVGLNFSCDGSHYMPVDEFLSKDTEFWFGENSGKAVCNA